MSESQKTEVPGIYKVGEGVLINKDNEGLKGYKAQKKRLNRFQEYETDLNNMRNDLTEIKNLLKGLVK
jgi:hypothetical protein